MNIRYIAPKGNLPNEWYSVIKAEDTSGKLIGVVSLKGGVGFDANRAGGLVADEIIKTVIERESEEILVALKKALKKAKNRLVSLIEYSKDNLEVDKIEINVVLLFVQGTIAYFSKSDDGGLYIQRGTEIINLGKILEDSSDLRQIFTGSGILEKGDRLLLVTKHVDEDKIAKTFESVELQENLDDKVALEVVIGAELPFKKQDRSANADYGEANINVRQDESEDKTDDLSSLEGDELLVEDNTSKLKKDEEIPQFEEDIANNNRDSSFSDLEEELPQDSQTDHSDQSVSSRFGELANSSKKFFGKGVSGIKSIGGRNASSTKQSRDGGSRNDKTYLYIIKKFFRLISSSFTKFALFIRGKLNFGQKRFKIREKRGANYKKVAAIIILIVIAGYYSTKTILKNREEKQNEALYNENYSKAEEAVSKAKEIQGLNDSRAKSYLEEALVYLDTAQELNTDSNSRVDDKKAEVMGVLDEIEGIVALSDYEVVFDSITSFESNGIVDMAIIDSNVYVLDSKVGNIYSVSASGGFSEKVLDDGDLKDPYRIEGLSDGTLVVFDKEEGLMSVNPKEKTSKKLAGMSPSTVGNIEEITLYKIDNTDYLYTLNPAEGRINKIPKIGENYSIPQMRLEGSEIAGAVDLSIDGNIYVLLPRDPGILRYYANNRENINIISENGLDFSGFVSFEASEKSPYFYVLDRANKRMLVIDKPSADNPVDLNIVEQIVYRGDKNLFSDLKEVKIGSEGLYLFVLDDSRILKIPVK